MATRKAVSLQDVARKAGVSVSTASRVLNTKLDLHLFSEDSIKRVRRAAMELQYRPNRNAQALSSGKTYVLGVTAEMRPGRNLFEIGYFASLMGGVELALRESGYEARIIGARNDQSAVDRGREHYHQRRIDGLIHVSYLDPGSYERLVEDRHVPCVLVEEVLRATSLPALGVDYEAGLTEVVQHLAELGHKRVLWLGPDVRIGESISRRERAFTSAAWNASIHGSCCRFEGYEETDDRRSHLRFLAEADEALRAYLCEDGNFTAVVCYNDDTAAGAYRGIARAGRQVGRDIAVIGFDDERGARYLSPELTTVNPGLDRAGHRAAEILIEMVETPDAAEKLRGYQERIKPRLVVRGSTMRVSKD